MISTTKTIRIGDLQIHQAVKSTVLILVLTMTLPPSGRAAELVEGRRDFGDLQSRSDGPERRLPPKRVHHAA